MLAVLVRLLKCRARAVRCNALTAKLHRDFVRFGIGAFDSSTSGVDCDSYLLNDPAFLVVETTQKCAST